MSYERLAWDSDFFGLPIGRITADSSAEDLAESIARADADGIRCLYHLVPADALTALHSALRLGFEPFDIRVEFELILGEPDPQVASHAIREAVQADEAAVARLAEQTISATRFTRDRRFPPDRVNRLYPQWAHRGLGGGPERVVLLAEPAAGFVVCSVADAERNGSIELIGVDERFGRRGIGTALLRRAHADMRRAGAQQARVVTQGDNVPAQRLYQGLGYRTRAVGWWLHRWPASEL